MHIDLYQFGQIVIDGKTYTSDCVIYSGKVHANWWRKEGHFLLAKDLEDVIAARPAVLIIGCGASGLMKVSKETQQYLEQNGIAFEAYNTSEAVERFNELAAEDSNTTAAFHLTC